MSYKQYHVQIILGGKVIYETDVVADSEDQAREFAYDQLEMNSYAEAKRTI